MPRLFVGTFLSEEQQEKLGRLSAEEVRLSKLWGRKLRWVKPKKLHLTWFFLGSVDEALIPEIKKRLDTALDGMGHTRLQYEKPVVWPNVRMPRQLVLVPNTVPEQVGTIVGAIRKNLNGVVPDPDYKSFKPHITLLRFDRAPRFPLEPGSAGILPASPEYVTEAKAGTAGVPPAPGRSAIVIPEYFPPDGLLPVKHEITEVALIQSHLGKSTDEYDPIHVIKLA